MTYYTAIWAYNKVYKYLFILYHNYKIFHYILFVQSKN